MAYLVLTLMPQNGEAMPQYFIGGFDSGIFVIKQPANIEILYNVRHSRAVFNIIENITQVKRLV